LREAEELAVSRDENLIVAVGRWLNAPNLIDAVQNDIYRNLQPPGVCAMQPEQLCDFVIKACMGWSNAQIDDVSLMIAKYHGE
jgi:hypothetical protein